MEQDHVLYKLAEGFNVSFIGKEFFSFLCTSLIKILDVEYVCISKLNNDNQSVETLSYCSQQGILPNIEYELVNTPCEKVVEHRGFCHFSSNVQELFPNDKFLKELSIESYSGITIQDSSGTAIGLIVALHTKIISNPEYVQNLFKVVAKRVELEMERLIHEEKIRRNEAQLNEAQQIANVGSFEWDVVSNKLHWSDQLFRIYGYLPGEISVSLDVYLKHIHPKYLSRVKTEIENAIRNNEAFDHEYMIIDKSGKQKILHSIGKVVATDGKVKKLLGVCHDITIHKRAEYELVQLNAELEERVKKRTERLERSLTREKLIREISELTINQPDQEKKIIQQIAEKAGAFLKADGLQIIRIRNEFTMEFELEGKYYRDRKKKYDNLFRSIRSNIKIKSFSEKNVDSLLGSLQQLPAATREKLPPEIQSLLVFEFSQNTRPYGILLVFHCYERKWHADELQFLDEMLNLLGSALFKEDLLHRKKRAIEESISVRNQLKLITDGAPAFISYVDKNLNYLYVNSFYTDFFGLEEKDIIGKNVKDLLDEKTYSNSYQNYKIALSGKKIQFENIAYDKDGKAHELEVQFIPEIQSGEVNGLIILATVITDRKNIERKLKESEERLRMALDASLLGAWDFDLVTNKLIWDDRCKKMIGLPSTAELSYKMFLNTVHPEDREKIDKKVKAALKPGKTGFFDEEFRTAGSTDKDERWIKSTGRALFKGKKPYRFIGISQDITLSKCAEAELKEIQRRLEQKNKMLEMLQNVSRIISGELEHQKVVQTITDTATALIGAEFGAFINNTNDEIREAYHFVTLSGITFSGFQKFPIPGDASIFIPTFKGEKIVRYKDVSKEITPAIQHPFLKSYIAVPVYSKENIVIGGLFFGHSEPGVFTEESEKILAGIAPQASIALDNARLFNESQLAKQHAEQQRNILYNIFNRAPSLISVCKGKDFVYEFVNSQYDNYFPHMNLLGQSLRKGLLERGHESFVNILDSVYSTGETYNGKEIPIEINKGSERKVYYYDFIIQALKNEKSEIEGIITYATDISEQVYARKTIEEFMSVASHELKTPLTTVMAYSELLEDALEIKEESAKAGYISKMNSNLSKLNNLISDLLDISRIQSGKMVFKNEKIEFDAFIKECLDNMKYTSKSHQIKLSGSSDVVVCGDREKLEQAIANIVSNAIKYSPRAEEIAVTLRKTGKKVMVSFKDYGMGIPEDKMKHLFQRFYRIEEKGTSGLGIGLYITKEIIDRHGGEIIVESIPGEGATFKIFLPVELC